MCQQLVERGAIPLQLSKSYRSVPNIQRAVNAAFRPVMDGNLERLQAGYVALEPSRGEHEGQPSVVALPVPAPYAQRYVTAKRIEQCLPDTAGVYVQWLATSRRSRRSPTCSTWRNRRDSMRWTAACRPGFVDTLQLEASTRQAAEAPILEEGSDGVRLMTVHKAKGLEFPVVILADITARLTPYEAGRYIDPDRGICALRIGGWSPNDLNDHKDTELERERAEGERVAYVAATRARDLLVVPAAGDGPYAEGSIAPLNTGVYPMEGARRTFTAAPGCPVFTSRARYWNGRMATLPSMSTVCPGEHRLGVADHEVSVVLVGARRALARSASSFGLRRDDLIVRDVSPTVASETAGRSPSLADGPQARAGRGECSVAHCDDGHGVGRFTRR